MRKEIPERAKQLKAVLPNVESLETGLLDLNAWLDNGEALLDSHKLDGTQEETEQRLERHKQYFQDITYQKSIVESKNKVYQKVATAKPKLKNIDFSVIDQPVEEMNQRFQICVSKAKDWEKKLDNLSCLWRALHQKQHTMEGCLDQAQAVFEDEEEDFIPNYSKSIYSGSEEYFTSSLLDGSDEVKSIQCEPCQSEGNSLEAEKYCTDCKEYLCGQCCKHHFKFKAFKHHKVQDVDA